MSNNRLCRLCRSTVPATLSVSLFSPRGVEQQWSSRIIDLLGVIVTHDDGRPQHMCRKCTRRVEYLEKAAQDLHDFRQESLASYESLTPRGGPLKRTKDCSGSIVSPDTARNRPAAKRSMPKGRRLDFGHSLSTESPSLDDSPTQDDQVLAPATASVSSQNSSSLLTTTDPMPLQDCTLSGNKPSVQSSSSPRKSVMVTVSTPSRSTPWTRNLSDEESMIGRALAGGHLPSVAKAVMGHDQLRKAVVLRVLDQLDSECTKLCQNSTPISPFNKVPVMGWVGFQWEQFINELQIKAPLLLQMLSTIASHNDHRNQHKRGNAHFPGICMAAAVILKERSQRMTGIQSLISLTLFAARVDKQVYTRLNHVSVCVSYPTTLRLVEEVSKHHDVPVQKWIENGAVFKFIGDNIDKKRGVRDIRSDHSGDMLHMYSVLSARSRLPSLELSRLGQVAHLTAIPWKSFLPSEADVELVKQNLVVVVSRLLTHYIKALSPLSKSVPQHIEHRYSQQMSRRSEVVVLDVLMKKETCHSDMIDIMQTMQAYLGDDYPASHRVASGGDYLTCERQLGSQRHLMDGDTPRDRLELLEPQTEDWHCLVSMLTVIWKFLFGQTSRDHGSLGYFKSLLNRAPVKKSPKEDVNACLDFLLTVVKGHLLAAACSYLGINTLDAPVNIPADVRRGSNEEKYTFVKSVATHVVDTYTVIEGAITGKHVAESGDSVNNYAHVLCHYGALVMEFLDAWHEGDGEHVYRCWRLFLPHFLVSNHRKYALEALRLQVQVEAVLSPHLAHHIMWDRFINTRGGMGRNIPCDLHNEHINKLLKHVITSMGANLTEEALRRAARSVSTLEAVCQQFDRCTGVPSISHSHSTVSDMQDVGKVMKTVIERELLSIVSGRKHTGFPTISMNPLKAWDMDQTRQWIEKKKAQFLKYQGAVQEQCDDSDLECSSESDCDD